VPALPAHVQRQVGLPSFVDEVFLL
jgi:hypothetical protein